MVQGTTPWLAVALRCSESIIEEIEITISQESSNTEIKKLLSKGEVIKKANNAHSTLAGVHLTQDETFLFDCGPYKIQARAKSIDGEVIATRKGKGMVAESLSKEVI